MKTKYLSAVSLFLLLATLCCVIVLSGVTTSRGEENQMVENALPASLKIIMDEAFWGTDFHTVFLDGQVVYIGNRVFANMDSLTDIYIPESVEFIGYDAVPVFAVVHGIKGSFAQTWTEEYGGSFVVVDRWNAENVLTVPALIVFLIMLWTALASEDEALLRVWKRMWSIMRSMRPQDRIELYPIVYKFP